MVRKFALCLNLTRNDTSYNTIPYSKPFTTIKAGICSPIPLSLPQENCSLNGFDFSLKVTKGLSAANS